MPRQQAKARILLVDDSPETLDVLERNLGAHGYEVRTSGGAAEAIDRLAVSPADLVVTDLRMPGMSGMELIRHVRENLPDTAVMMITGYATIEGAVEAVKTGAEEYLAKPFTDEELLGAVGRALGKLRAQRDARSRLSGGRFGLVGESESFRRALASLQRILKDGGPVLIIGEPGTGRGASARVISSFREGPRSRVLCLECSRYGADAVSGSEAHLAEGGVLFLRGLEWADPAAQDKILGLLTAQAFTEGRVLVSACPDLAPLLQRGLLRGDLHDVLSRSVVAWPALRERGDDVLLLASHFAAALSERLGAPGAPLEAGVARALRAYEWPGNIAELQGVIVDAFTRSGGKGIELGDLPGRVRAAGKEARGARTLAEVEAAHVRETVAASGGRIGQAASVLGIDRKTLREKLRAPEKSGASGRHRKGKRTRGMGPGPASK